MIATRSPGSTPRATSPLATAVTSAANAETVTGVQVPSTSRSANTPSGSRASRSVSSPGMLAAGSSSTRVSERNSRMSVLRCRGDQDGVARHARLALAVDEGERAGDAAGRADVVRAPTRRPAAARRARRASTAVISVRIDTLASDFTLRSAASAEPAAATTASACRGGAQRLGVGPRRAVHRTLAPPRPDLLGGERQHRREQAQQHVERDREGGAGRRRSPADGVAP